MPYENMIYMKSTKLTHLKGLKGEIYLDIAWSLIIISVAF